MEGRMEFQTPTASEVTIIASLYNVTIVSIMKASILGITATLILLGNSMCLIVLRYTRDGVSPVTKLFLVSLTISDLLVGVLVCVPIVGSTALQGWPYGGSYCTLVAMCHVLYFNAGLSVLAINIERYIAVMWPLRYPSIVTMNKAIIAEVCIIAILLVWTMLYVLLPDRSSFYYNNFSQCYIDANEGADFIGHLGMSLFIALPVFITVILHVRLFFLAASHASRVGNIRLGDINTSSVDTESSSGQHTQQPLHAPAAYRPGRGRAIAARKTPEARAARTFFLMALVLTISWTPYYTTIAWENFRSEQVPEVLAFGSQVLLLLNSLWNVIIYYTRNGPFRKTANRLLGCCFRFRTRREQELIT